MEETLLWRVVTMNNFKNSHNKSSMRFEMQVSSARFIYFQPRIFTLGCNHPHYPEQWGIECGILVPINK